MRQTTRDPDRPGSRRQWHAVERELRGRTDAKVLRQRCASMIETAVRHGIPEKPLLERALPLVVRSFPTSVAIAVMDLAVFLV
jgi:hypothetical protein